MLPGALTGVPSVRSRPPSQANKAASRGIRRQCQGITVAHALFPFSFSLSRSLSLSLFISVFLFLSPHLLFLQGWLFGSNPYLHFLACYVLIFPALLISVATARKPNGDRLTSCLYAGRCSWDGVAKAHLLDCGHVFLGCIRIGHCQDTQ